MRMYECLNVLDEKYGLVHHADKDAILTMQLSDLQDIATADAFVLKVLSVLNTDERKVAGTHLASWFGHLCAGFHAALSLYNKVLNLRTSDITFQLCVVEGKRKIKFVLNRMSLIDAPIEMTARNEAINTFYQNMATNFIDAISLPTGLKHHMLWSQFVTRMYNEKDQWLEIYQEDRVLCKKIEDDFGHLFNNLPLEQLQLKRNPFDANFIWINHMSESNKSIRQRIVCCFAYKTGKHNGYCYSCPQMNAEERELRRGTHS